MPKLEGAKPFGARYLEPVANARPYDVGKWSWTPSGPALSTETGEELPSASGSGHVEKASNLLRRASDRYSHQSWTNK